MTFEGSRYLPDSPIVTRRVCPGCDPDAADLTQLIELWPCPSHVVSANGEDDAKLTDDLPLSGTAECEGETNRAWCALLRQG